MAKQNLNNLFGRVSAVFCKPSEPGLNFTRFWVPDSISSRIYSSGINPDIAADKHSVVGIAYGAHEERMHDIMVRISRSF